jgi:hypothetical protein
MNLMNGYSYHNLWLDTDSGTYGAVDTLVLIETADWQQEDCDLWESWTDGKREEYADLYEPGVITVRPTQLEVLS